MGCDIQGRCFQLNLQNMVHKFYNAHSCQTRTWIFFQGIPSTTLPEESLLLQVGSQPEVHRGDVFDFFDDAGVEVYAMPLLL